ncbi:PREDICTED: probable tRNA (uracil-O(2)-)-methyltransferase [Chrysochloris asiatica]|uniref:tRNA (uracil-O(2)-)-methyltransferase n=1 Tax=Chrysochloris asiatica TaxID=185453 RepID=A0A9B0X1Y7_CHRAS|nr:PREDICTED: probable tRNA (uracil-O(2)-)-methyltransferase [Chrysochloris asiatica]
MAEVGRAVVRDPGALLPGGFWAAVAVWLERPQVANKRLCGARLEARWEATLPRAEPESPGSPPSPSPRAGPERGGAAVWEPDSLWGEFSRSLASGDGQLLAFLAGAEAGLQPAAPGDLDVVLRTIIPKRQPQCPCSTPGRELVLQDVPRGAVTFVPLEEDTEGNIKVKMSNVYQIQLHQGQEAWFISVLIFCPERWHSDGIVYPRPTWLGSELLTRLAKWAVESKKSEFTKTLSLVPITKYSQLYQELKEQYKEMVKVWPEVTDPEKFVYEDVAIATYLLILWEEERAKRGVVEKQSFVDLGCGNGLLTHILHRAGHPGRGIDVRRRHIWTMFGAETHLEEGAITPDDRNLFPDADWLIGNHSDELTPWIPVIAARSSYRCRFFVLPCCFFGFAGKYRRRQSQKTQYREYLDFIREVGQACGFHVEEDCLRIPSTKRVCLIGKSRTYPPAREAAVDAQRAQYIHSWGGPWGPGQQDCTTPQDGPRTQDAGAQPKPEPVAAAAPAQDSWLPGFRPRDRVERVRNCAALPGDFVDRVVVQVAHLLLGGKPACPGDASPEAGVLPWNPGGSLSLAEVASKLDSETLQRLKRECGGLQTLLRNRHQVFTVRDGRVRIRDWRKEQPPRGPAADAFKTRPCWFFTHHPDGCVLSAARCPFAHGPGELRPAQITRRARQLPRPVPAEA